MTHLADTDAGEEGQSSANVTLTNRVGGNAIFLIGRTAEKVLNKQ